MRPPCLPTRQSRSGSHFEIFENILQRYLVLLQLIPELLPYSRRDQDPELRGRGISSSSVTSRSRSILSMTFILPSSFPSELSYLIYYHRGGTGSNRLTASRSPRIECRLKTALNSKASFTSPLRDGASHHTIDPRPLCYTKTAGSDFARERKRILSYNVHSG